jgi:putative Mn2+ efflux pump MntP
LFLFAGNLSTNNLIVGFSLGLGRLDPLMLATTMAVFSMVFAWTGLHLGSAGRRHWMRPAGIGAGLLLLAVAIAMFAGWL